MGLFRNKIRRRILQTSHRRMKWALVTERYGFDAPEFDCRDIREMVKYITQSYQPASHCVVMSEWAKAPARNLSCHWRTDSSSGIAVLWARSCRSMNTLPLP